MGVSQKQSAGKSNLQLPNSDAFAHSPPFHPTSNSRLMCSHSSALSSSQLLSNLVIFFYCLSLLLSSFSLFFSYSATLTFHSFLPSPFSLSIAEITEKSTFRFRLTRIEDPLARWVGRAANSSKSESGSCAGCPSPHRTLIISSRCDRRLEFRSGSAPCRFGNCSNRAIFCAKAVAGGPQIERQRTSRINVAKNFATIFVDFLSRRSTAFALASRLAVLGQISPSNLSLSVSLLLRFFFFSFADHGRGSCPGESTRLF